jgi:hypothetical protein
MLRCLPSADPVAICVCATAGGTAARALALLISNPSPVCFADVCRRLLPTLTSILLSRHEHAPGVIEVLLPV